MYSYLYKLIHVVGFTMLLSTSMYGQYFEAGAKLGLASYWGDLSVPDFETNLSTSKIAVAGFFKYNIDGYFSVSSSLLYTSLTGDDSMSNLDWQIQRNLSFKTTITEFSIRGEVNAFEFDASRGDHVFAPYFFIGLSAFYFNPKALYYGQYYELQPLGTEGQGIVGHSDKYSRFSGAFIYGGGLKFRVNDVINFGIELNTNRGFTDYIDDVSTEYADYDLLQSNNGEMAAILSSRSGEIGETPGLIGAKRGGKTVPDYYISGLITLSYNFIGKNKINIFKKTNSVNCPKF